MGLNTDFVPAGDLASAAAKSLTCSASTSASGNEWTGVLTGKGLSFGGSLARTEATGYGLVYFVDEYLKSKGDSFEGKKVVVHGPATWPSTRSRRSRSSAARRSPAPTLHGWVEDQEGIDYQVLEHVYNKKRSGHDKGVTLAMYVDERPNATWHEEDGRGVWQLPCDIALRP